MLPVILKIINEAEEQTGTRPSEEEARIAWSWAKKNNALRGRDKAEQREYFQKTLFPQIIRRERFYRTELKAAKDNLQQLFKTCIRTAGKPLNTKLNIGRGVKVIIGQPGTNMLDVARYCLELNLGIDFTTAARRYDDLRPDYNYRKFGAQIDRTKDASQEEREKIKSSRTAHQSHQIDQYMRRIKSAKDINNQPLFTDEFGSWSDARRKVSSMATTFLNNTMKAVMVKFIEIYPDSYWDFLQRQDDGKVYYTSEAAVPISINALSRATKVSALQTSVKQYFIDVQAKIDRAIKRATDINAKDMDDYRDKLIDVIKDLNSEIDPTGGLSITIGGIDKSLTINQITTALVDAKKKLLGRIGRILLRKCMDPSKIPTDDNEVRAMTTKCDEPTGNIQLAGGTFAFNLGFEGAQPAAINFTLEKHGDYTSGDEAWWAKKKEISQDPEILQGQKKLMSRGTMPSGSSNPQDLVIFQFKAPSFLNDDEDAVKEDTWVAVRISREEVFARNLHQKGNIVEYDHEIDQPTKEHLDNYKAYMEQHCDTYNGWMEYRSNPRALRDALADSFRDGDLGKAQDIIDQKGIPVKIEFRGSDESDSKLKIGESHLNRFVKTLLLLNVQKDSPSYYLNSGSYPLGTIVVEPNEVNWKDMPEMVPVFFTSEDGCYVSQSDYKNLLKNRPWPSYADNNGKLDPTKPVPIKYINDEGEEKTEVLNAQQVYEYGLDNPRIKEKYGIELGGDEERSSEYITPPVFFFTDIEKDQQTGIKACPFCSEDDHAIFHAEEDTTGTPYNPNDRIWDPRLKLQGRNSNDKIKITYRDQERAKDQVKTVVIRRHELLERYNDLIDRLGNLHISPYFEDSEFSCFAVKDNRLKAIPLGNDKIDAQKKLEHLKTEASLDVGAGSGQNVTYPEGLGDTIDYGDRVALDQTEKKSKYFNPFQGKHGSYGTITGRDFADSRRLYQKAIDGKFTVDDESRDQLIIDPLEAGKSRAWVSVEGDQIFVVWPLPHKVMEHIGAEEGEQTIRDNEIAVDGADAKNMDNYLSDNKSFWKTPVYPDEQGNYVVDMPYFINLNTPKQTFTGEHFGRNEIGAFKTLLRAPVRDPENLEVRFVSQARRGRRQKSKRGKDSERKPTGVRLTYGEHFTLNPITQNREIIWQGNYPPRVKQQDSSGEIFPTLTIDDLIEVNYDAAEFGLYFTVSPVPFVKALDIARDRWRDYEIARKKWTTSKRQTIQANLDLNGIARIEDQPAMSWLQVHEGNAAQAFSRKYGSFLCGRPVRSAISGAGVGSPGSEKRVPCQNKAAHARLPRTIVQAKKAKVFIRDRQDIFADYESGSDEDAIIDIQSVGSAIVEPEWTWVNGAAVKLRDKAESDTVTQYFGKAGREMTLKRADIADRKGGQLAVRSLDIGSHAGGMCHPCWMAQYEIIPKKIIEDMWADLSEIEGIATKMLVKTQLELEQSGYEQELTGQSGASYSPRGYKSEASKGEESDEKRLRIKKRKREKPGEAPKSGFDPGEDFEEGYAYLDDEFGEKSYAWVKVNKRGEETVSSSYAMQNWVDDWIADNPDAARHMKVMEDDKEKKGFGLYRIQLTNIGKSRWEDLLKYISSKHRELGGNESGWRYLDPSQYEGQLSSEITGYELARKTDKDNKGILKIRYSRAFGPREENIQTWKHVETGREYNFSDNDIVAIEPMSRTFGKGYERSVGRLYQITMPDGSPRVVEIIRHGDDFNDEEQIKVRFMDQPDETVEDMIVSAIRRTTKIKDRKQLKAYVENASEDMETFFHKIRKNISPSISDEEVREGLDKVIGDWRTAFRNYREREDSNVAVLPRSVIEDQGGPTPLDTRIVKMLIIEKMAEFYINYLAIGTSFWSKIKEEIDYLEGMQDNQKIRLVGRLISWHDHLVKEFEELTDPDTGMLDQGVTPKDFNGPAGIPWFSVTIQRYMRQIGNLYFWTQYLKRRYGNRSALDVNDPSVVPITQLTRKDVRDRQSYYAALNDTGYKPTRLFSLGNYHRKNLGQEDKYRGGRSKAYTESKVKTDRVLIYNVFDAQYLNGLTGVVEGKNNDYYVVRLDSNNVVEDEKVLLSEREILFYNGAPIQVLTEAANVQTEEDYVEEYKELVLEEIVEEELKSDIINLIGEFTSEHVSWD